MAAGTNTAALDFDSVQRGNPEIQRRAQEVINHCWALGETNPVLAIHDVGAGGISNAFPELVDGAGMGATFDLRRVPLESVDAGFVMVATGDVLRPDTEEAISALVRM